MVMSFGGKWVGGGRYMCLTSGGSVSVPRGGGILPGSSRTLYIRSSLAAFAVPLLGLVYVIFVPFIGIALVSWLVLQRVGYALKSAAVGALQVAIPSWRPGEAYLARGGRGKKKKEEKLISLEEELESMRQKEG